MARHSEQDFSVSVVHHNLNDAPKQALRSLLCVSPAPVVNTTHDDAANSTGAKAGMTFGLRTRAENHHTNFNHGHLVTMQQSRGVGTSLFVQPALGNDSATRSSTATPVDIASLPVHVAMSFRSSLRTTPVKEGIVVRVTTRHPEDCENRRASR